MIEQISGAGWHSGQQETPALKVVERACLTWENVSCVVTDTASLKPKQVSHLASAQTQIVALRQHPPQLSHAELER